MNRDAAAILRKLTSNPKRRWLQIEGIEGWIAPNPKARLDASKLARRALDAVDFPRGAIVPADTLNGAQREVAEVLALRAGVYSSKHALPDKAWVRRRWLGLERAGALEKLVSLRQERKRLRMPLWQALRVAKPSELARGMSLTKRLDAYGDLVHEPYGVGAVAYAPWVSLDEIGTSGKAWARRTADRWVVLWSHDALQTERGPFSTHFRLVLFLTLARTGARIRPEWDMLLPVLDRLPGVKSAAPHKASKECLQALPDDRRNAVLASAMKSNASAADAVEIGVKLIRAFPSEPFARALLQRLTEVRRPPAKAMKTVHAVARRHADVATALEGFEERRGRVHARRKG